MKEVINDDIYGMLLETLVNKRKMMGLTQEDMSKLCGASQSHIGAVERGKYVASADLILRYEKVVGVGFGGDKIHCINSELASLIFKLDEDQQNRLAVIIKAAFF